MMNNLFSQGDSNMNLNYRKLNVKEEKKSYTFSSSEKHVKYQDKVGHLIRFLQEQTASIQV